jgi:hypothetical protein
LKDANLADELIKAATGISVGPFNGYAASSPHGIAELFLPSI